MFEIYKSVEGYPLLMQLVPTPPFVPAVGDRVIIDGNFYEVDQRAVNYFNPADPHTHVVSLFVKPVNP